MKIILGLILILFISCVGPSDSYENVVQYHIDTESLDIKKDIRDIKTSDIEFIKLETTNECILSRINKLIVKDGYLFILDRLACQVFCFNKDGGFIRTYGKQGHGPGELTMINDFIIYNDSELWILDNNTKRIVQFELKTGRWLKDNKLSDHMSNMVQIHSGKLFGHRKNSNYKYKSNMFNICEIEDFKIKKGYLPHTLYDTSLGHFNCFPKSTKIFFASYFEDVIYELNDSGVHPFISLDFGSSKISEDFLKTNKHTKGIISYIKKKKPSKGICNIYEGEDLIFFNLTIRGNPNIILIDKKEKTITNGNSISGPLNKMLSLRPLAFKDDIFFSSINAYHLSTLENDIKNNEDSLLYEQYKSVRESIDLNSNPVLIKYKLSFK